MKSDIGTATRSAQQIETVPPMDDDAFDAYVAEEHFQCIERVAVMEQFLIRAARRYHALVSQQLHLSDDADPAVALKLKARDFLREQFGPAYSDLRMFFSETDDFPDQPVEERKRLMAVAEALQCSALNASKIDAAELIGGANLSVAGCGFANATREDSATEVDDEATSPHPQG
jgi:hypothetical protein